MAVTKTDIIGQLKKDILSLQGYKPLPHDAPLKVGLGAIKGAFSDASFPLRAVHEFFCTSAEDVTASTGFIAGILSSLMSSGGVLLWISSSRTVFPPALKAFGVNPDKIIFIDLKKEKEILWAMEEALKCSSLAAVVGEIADISFTTSRRFQLAVERSGVTSFIMRRNARNLTTACTARWRITSLASRSLKGMPGVGFPCWNVELLKVRNGTPGSWQTEWREGKFSPVYNPVLILSEQKRKTG